MIDPIPDILARIVARKRDELASLRERLPGLEAQSNQLRRGFAAALAQSPPSIIAEIKQASPSKGVLSHSFDPARQAASYEAGGAAALSVLTDEHFFRGSLDHLRTARASTGLPVLRKDFTIDRAHIVEAAAHGADAILLIAAILSEVQLRDFREQAESFGMDALVEVHERPELDRAIASGARIIGVNNRDLRTFDVRLETSLDLAPLIPSGVLRVSESGIRTHADIARLGGAGYAAFLVGEHLMRASDAKTELRRLRGVAA